MCIRDRYKNAPIHHCLAAGPNVGTVEEGALKIIELAWVPAEGREMEDFLHGRYREVDETDVYKRQEIILAGGKAFSLPTMIHGFSMFAL